LLVHVTFILDKKNDSTIAKLTCPLVYFAKYVIYKMNEIAYVILLFLPGLKVTHACT